MTRTLALAIASGLLMALALPLAIPWISLRPLDPAGHLELVAWLALVPGLLALDRARSWKGALAVGLAAGLAYFYTAIWWVNHAMTSFGGVAFPVALLGLSLLVLYMAVHWAAAFAVSFAIRRRLGWPLWTHLPAVWAGFELLRNYLISGFPWANLGYTQARHLAVAQLASLGGVYAIAALVVLVNCALHAVARARLERAEVPWRPVAAAAAAVVATLAYGASHLSGVRARAAAAPKLTVALVQGNVNQSVKNQARTYADSILSRYVPLTVEADRRGVDLVAWPEASYPYLVPPRLSSFAGPRTGLPRLERAHLLLGVATYSERREGDRRVAEGSNSVFLLTPDLTVVGRYSKHHLVPFGEYVPGWLSGVLRSVVPEMAQQRPGSELVVLEFPAPRSTANSTSTANPTSTSTATATPNATSTSTANPTANPSPDPPPSADRVRLAPMICFDAIFPEVNVAFAGEDPDVLVNPTNDAWYGYSSGPYQFLAIVQMRAIEAGKAVVRPAYAGVSALIDPTGEVQPGALPVGPVDPDLAPDPDEPPRLLIGEVPRLRGRTLYTTVGDLFAGAASLYGAGALALALLARRRAAPREGASS
jgi:apolipoprotein N-acyltransferase